MHRFRCIEMRVPWEFLSDLGSVDSPILSEIMINLYDFPEPLDFVAFSVLKQMSSLRRATIGAYINITEALLFPLNQLDELHLQCPYDVKGVLDILEQCNNLREFSLTMPYSTGFIDPGNRVITLPNLRTLSIQTEDLMLEVFLRVLVVPGLRALIVNSMPLSIGTNTDPADRCRRLYPGLSAMITRSSCSLERFDFPYMQAFSDNLVECLSLMLGLTDLELFSFDSMAWQDSIQGIRKALGNPLLRLLTPTIDTPSACLLPNLQSIRLIDYAEMSDTAILEFVHSRRQSGQPGIARLARVYILRIVDYEEARPISPEFVSLRNNGLDITVEDLGLSPKIQSFDPWQGLTSN